jgi:manganese transport protein
VKTRAVAPTPHAQRRALRYFFIDTTLALNFAFLINAAILIVAAGVFHARGVAVDDLREAHQLLSPLLGAGIASLLFAIALLCAGQSATITGTLAGQIVMEGFLQLRLPPIVRRALTRGLAVIPAIAVLGWKGEESTLSLLVATQVVLSLQLPFAIVPLIRFTSSGRVMGGFATPWLLNLVAWTAAAFVVAANVWLVGSMLLQWESRALAAAVGVAYLAFLAYVTIAPLAYRTRPETAVAT